MQSSTNGDIYAGLAKRIPRPPLEEVPGPDISAARMWLKTCLSRTEGMFLCRTALPESDWEAAMQSIKEILLKSQQSPPTRKFLGGSLDVWWNMTTAFEMAIPRLKEQSFIPGGQAPGEPMPSVTSFMCSNSGTLLTDIERLGDLTRLARNLVVDNLTAQDFSCESGFDQKVLQVLEICIRVCARAVDSDPASQQEHILAQITNQYKYLLVSSLQFLHNSIIKNEGRKLALWLDLFGHAMDIPLGLDYDGTAYKSIPNPKHISTEYDDLTPENYELDFDQDPTGELPHCSDVETAAQRLAIRSIPYNLGPKQVGQTPEQRARAEEINSEDWESLTDMPGFMTYGKVPPFVLKLVEPRPSKDYDSPAYFVSATARFQWHKDSKQGLADNIPVAFPELEEDDVQDEIGNGLATLHTSKFVPIPHQFNSLADNKGEVHIPPSQPVEDADDDDEEEEEDEEDDEEDEDDDDEEDDDDTDPTGTSYKHRGLLAEIPLILGPNDIEALPLILQTSIYTPREAENVSDIVRFSQALRCNLLVLQDQGRHLLRELLIFIAAWDLQEEELYFKLMVNIMDSILYHGLMPRAYDYFRERKDIVSPAQTTLVKMLTAIFRRKKDQGPPYNPTENDTEKSIPQALIHDKAIIYEMVFEFRNQVLPQTVAYIWLQGKIRLKQALPEDFPLNLWDVERIYEGVYQFLEFFAVLTETFAWKKILVNQELALELIELLRALDNSVPKASLVPAGGQAPAGSAQGAPGPIPVAVERPFDTNAGSPTRGASPPLSAPRSAHAEAVEACQFEWRNLKKLVILVLSSLVWKSPTVKTQVRELGGVELMMGCCNIDEHNPFIREHAMLCLKFLLEDCPENKEIVRNFERMEKQMDPSDLGP